MWPGVPPQISKFFQSYVKVHFLQQTLQLDTSPKSWLETGRGIPGRFLTAHFRVKYVAILIKTKKHRHKLYKGHWRISAEALISLKVALSFLISLTGFHTSTYCPFTQLVLS